MSLAEVAVTSADALVMGVDEVYRAADSVLVREGVGAIDEGTIQRLLTLAVKLYVAKREAGDEFSPFVGESATATEVAVTAQAMLKAVQLDVFELSLWRGWGRV